MGYQGPKLTFFDRRQLVTEIFFQSPDGKMWSPKSVKKISFAVKHKWMENSGRQFFIKESKWKEHVLGRSSDFCAKE